MNIKVKQIVSKADIKVSKDVDDAIKEQKIDEIIRQQRFIDSMRPEYNYKYEVNYE